MPTTLTFERQKMNVEMWEKLRSHIVKQREKRKQEQEQDAEQERHRREQELKRKRDATTLEDIKDQLSRLEANLSELKKKKNELFIQLKKVLNEDEMRKKQQENEVLAAKHAALLAQNNQQFNPYLINPTTIVNSRLQNTNSTQQQLNTAIQQQQQLLAKHSPITTVTSLSGQPNYINTVITQSLTPAHQQPQQLTNKQQRATNSLKRSHERTASPQPNYNNVLPNYKTPMTSYTPAVSKISTTSHQAFFPQNRHLASISVSQPSMSTGQLNFDSKSPYQFLPTTGLSSTDSAIAAAQAAAEHANVINLTSSLSNSGQLSAQQISQLQQQESLYHQQFMKNINMANLQSPSLMSMQNTALKQQGGITTGFSIQQRPQNNNSPSTSANTNSNNRFPGYMY